MSGILPDLVTSVEIGLLLIYSGFIGTGDQAPVKLAERLSPDGGKILDVEDVPTKTSSYPRTG